MKQQQLDKYSFFKYSTAIAAFAAIAVACIACKNDVEVVKSLTIKQKSPSEASTNLHLFFSENGIIKQEFIFEKLNHYEYAEKYYESPNSFEVITYDELGNKNISLTADYGISYQEKKIMEAKRNVVITNFSTGEIIETEHLVWDENKHLIYSNTQIKQTKPDGSVYIGDRFESDESMEKYTVFNPKIIFYAEEN